MLVPDKRVAEVVSRLTGVPVDQIRVSSASVQPLHTSFDSLDTIELIMELEEEFDKETVRWASDYIEACSERTRTAAAEAGIARSPDGANPLWDADLDG